MNTDHVAVGNTKSKHGVKVLCHGKNATEADPQHVSSDANMRCHCTEVQTSPAAGTQEPQCTKLAF